MIETRRVGTWELGNLLGAGRMGSLYEARDAGGRQVAVRVFAAGVASDAARRAQLVEACQRLSEITYPGLIAVLDLLGTGGDLYLVTSFIDGPSLATVLFPQSPPGNSQSAGWLRGWQGTSASAATVLNEIAQSLQALHSHRLAHGSLVPSSVLVAPDGTARLADAAVGSVVMGSSLLDGAMADARAWAALARAVRQRWVDANDPFAKTLEQAAEAAAPREGSRGSIAAGLEQLYAGASYLPADFRDRKGLREMTTLWMRRSATAAPSWAASASAIASTAGPAAPAARTLLQLPTSTITPRPDPVRPSPQPPAAAAMAAATVFDPHQPGASPGGNLRSPAGIKSPPPQGGARTLPPPQGEGRGGGAAVRWPAAQPPDGRASASPLRWLPFLLAGLVIAAAAYLGITRFVLPPALAAETANVTVSTTSPDCNSTVVFSGTVLTNGNPGTLTYEWVRNDGVTTGGPQTQTVTSGTHAVNARLTWTVHGLGNYVAQAELRVLSPNTVPPAIASFHYNCVP